MFHKQYSAPFQIGSNHPRQLRPKFLFLPTSNNEIIINYTSKIPFNSGISELRANPCQTANSSCELQCVLLENRGLLKAGEKEKEMGEEAGKEDWNTRRVPLPSWATRNPSFSSSTSNFVSSIGPLIVLLGNEYTPHVIALWCYSYLARARVAWFLSAEGDDRKFSERFFVESVLIQ